MSQRLQPCPHCGQTLDLTPLPPGQVVTCPYCKQNFTVGGAMPPAAQSFAAPTPPPPKRGNPLALVSLITGILFFVLLIVNVVVAIGTRGTGAGAVTSGIISILAILCALTALITGILGIRSTRDGTRGGKGMAITGTSLGGVAILLLVVGLLFAMPALAKARGAATRVKCASQLRMVGMNIMMYANDNKGYLPPSMGTLVTDHYAQPQDLICPTTGQTGSSTAYKYLGKSQKMISIRNPASHVLAYEPLSAHSDGINVLFADGHVEWYTATQASRLIADVESGRNPPPSLRGQ